MSEYIDSFKQNFQKAIERFKSEINSLRVGRSSPSLVENIQIDSYGTLTPLIHLASITTPDPKTIIIQPWDKNHIKEIERALQKAELGANPIIKENVILINIPPLTEEVRKELVKKLNHKSEDARVSVRNNREKVKEQVLKREKDKEIAEDDKYKMLEELDDLVKNYNEIIKEIADKKIGEIMKV